MFDGTEPTAYTLKIQNKCQLHRARGKTKGHIKNDDIINFRCITSALVRWTRACYRISHRTNWRNETNNRDKLWSVPLFLTHICIDAFATSSAAALDSHANGNKICQLIWIIIHNIFCRSNKISPCILDVYCLVVQSLTVHWWVPILVSGIEFQF